ncbi:MAG: outer membrane protein assembly factor BamA [Deltaproteobacteria bacterium]|nr:outer membrane protein assembly factor BamA [Deltaproteobacteria bacterium]
MGTPDIQFKQDSIYISIPVEEGPRYKVRKVDISGELIKPKKELYDGLKITKEVYYNREVLRQDLDNLVTIYADQGYAYADINPIVSENEKEPQVDINFNIEKKQVVYFEKILITGNTKTRDKVIRREFKIHEEGLFNGSALRKSNANLHRLDYFETINVTTSKGSDDSKMIVKTEVKEKRTGAFSVGAGYSSVDKIIGMGQISQRNLFGRGQELTFATYLGGASSRYNISFTEPWLFDIPLRAGIDLFDWNRDFDQYTKESLGGKVRFSYPIWGQELRAGVMYKYDNSDITNVSRGAALVIQDMKGNHITSSTTTSLERDSRDHEFNTTKGSNNNIAVEYAGLGGTNSFTKYTAGSGWYFPLPWTTVGFIQGRIGYVRQNEGGDLPLYEKFFLGGINTMRGFEYAKVSPRDPATGDRIGGEKMMLFNGEYRFPLVPKAGLVGVAFYDTGNAFANSDGYDFTKLRKSAGLGIRWYSPIGPLRLEYGFNLDPLVDEPSGNWEFSVGSVF